MVINTGNGRAVSYDYPLPSIGVGLFAATGASNIYSVVNQFGRASAVAASTDTDIWDKAASSAGWTPPTSAQTHNIVSGDTNDAEEGTGARTVKVYGLDANWALTSETVTLNGTTAVATTGSYIRIYKLEVISVGSGGSNAGEITATASSDGTVTAAIEAGNNRSLMAIYSVPADTFAYILGYNANIHTPASATDAANIKLLIKENADAATSNYKVVHMLSVYTSATQAPQYHFLTPIAVSAKSDIVLRATDATATSTDITAGLSILLSTRD